MKEIFLKIIWILRSAVAIILPVLIRVAFVTLLERKILGFSQYRKGPNKVSIVGFLQPIADAIKLFVKEVTYLKEGNNVLFFFSPALAFFLILWIMLNLPVGVNIRNPQGLITILAVISLNIYPLFLRGWSSNSKYSLLGRIRGVAQTISYEIALALLLFGLILSHQVQLSISLSTNYSSMSILFFSPLILLLFVCCIAETNRTPFDFSEGERELVSGFNTEYRGGPFALIFIAEYGIIVFFSIFLSFLFVPLSFSSRRYCLVYFILLFLWIWLRTTFPRYRYDKLLNLAWKRILPWRLTLILYFVVFSIF